MVAIRFGSSVRSMGRAGLGLIFCVLIVGCENAASEKRGGPTDKLSPDSSSVAGTGKQPTVKVDLLLNWFPEAEHGGFYAALVHGFYQEAGLDVKILPGGPNVPVIQEVARQHVKFGISNADGILFGRAKETPVVSVLASLQTSPRCIMVHRKSGIKSFSELKNMTIAMTAGSAFAVYLQKKFPFEGVQIVPYPGNVAQFLLNENYAQQGYVFSEPFVAESKGGDPEVLMVSDVGFNPYTSCLIAHEKLIQADPELVRKMVQASVRGWERYLADPAETNRHIHDVNPEMDLDVLEYGVKQLRPLVLGDKEDPTKIGRMSGERWSTLVKQLVETGQLDAGSDQSDKAFTTQFLGATP